MSRKSSIRCLSEEEIIMCSGGVGTNLDLSGFDLSLSLAPEIPLNLSAEVNSAGITGDFYSGNYGNPYGQNMVKVEIKPQDLYSVVFNQS